MPTSGRTRPGIRRPTAPTRSRRAFTAACVLAGTVAAVVLSQGTGVTAQQADGRATYQRACATCHGTDARGSVGPALIPFARTDADLLTTVRRGGGQMLAFSARDLSDADVSAIASYLRTLPPAGSDRAAALTAVVAGSQPRSGTTTVSPVRQFAPVTDAMLANPAGADWLNWRRTLDGTGYSPLSQISAANVSTLRMVWSWALEPGASQTTPLVHDGTMYLANPGNVVHALDAATGDLLWEYRRPLDERRRASAQTRSLAAYGDTIVLCTVDAHIVALDARTGAVRWDVPAVTAQDAGFTFTSGPIVADGVIVAGLTGCSRFDDETCYIVGVDGATGARLWQTSTLARPNEPGDATWGGLPLTFRAGGDAWIPGSYDPVDRLVYWGTAQAKPWAQAARGTDGDALYTNATLALDPKSGQIRWHFQHLPGESFDMDEVFERILVDYDGRRSVFTMGKLGILWELDRKSGRFLNARDTGYQTLVDVNQRTGRATYKPGMLQRLGQEISFCPSTSGFKSLRAMAYHPDTGAMYVPLNLNCETATFDPVEQRVGGGGAGPVRIKSYDFHPKSPDAMGELQALDIRTGKPLWTTRRRAPYNTAVLTTGGGLLFVGSWDRFAFAYDARTGTELWKTRLPTQANGFPITYSVNGRQFVAIGAGASIQTSTWAVRAPGVLMPEMRNPAAGNGLFVFALDEPQR
jgi:alcohol dehydrogenase (cytochrome c)